MKHMIIGGAAGLLLSTTALAAVGASNKDMVATPTATPAATAAVAVSKNAPSLGAVPIGNAILIDHPAKSASVDATPASDAKTFTAGDSKAMVEPATAETPSTAVMAEAAAKDMQGVGGPEETDAATATTLATTAPQATYRACSPGPGDDNCIQLYEPGVRASYAAWQAGQLPGAVQTGMGGPEEDEAALQPAAAETEDQAVVQPAAAETEDLAAYDEPLPEDLVLPASDEQLAGNPSNRSNDGTMAI